MLRIVNIVSALCLTLFFLLGTVTSGHSADFYKGYLAYIKGDYTAALRDWKPLAQQGDADAQKSLGLMFEEGRGVAQNYKTAVKWYRLAAEQAHIKAQYHLAVMYEDGQGVVRDYVYAYMWYIVAANNGDALAVWQKDYLEKQMTSAQIENAKKLAKACIHKKYKDC